MVNDLRNGRKDGKMQHLVCSPCIGKYCHNILSFSFFVQTCFSGGMYALASVHAINGRSKHYMDIAKNITRTCRESYIQTGQLSHRKLASTLCLILLLISILISILYM